MKKMISMIAAAALGLSLLTGCSSASRNTAETTSDSQAEETNEETTEEVKEENAEAPVIRVTGLKGPTTMGLVKLMEDSKQGATENSYEFTMVTAADELTAMVAGGKTDIALLPANVSSVLFNKLQGGVTVIDINTLGVLYLVSSDTSVETPEQLKGKTVYLTGKGTSPEYVLRYLLSAAGLEENDVTLEFKSEPSEVASVLAENPEAIGLLPQPFVTSALAQNDRLSIRMDLTKVWDEFQKDGNGSRLVTGVTIVNTEFLKEHSDLVDRFLEDHKASIEFTAEDPETAASLIEATGIVPKAAIAKKALPYCNLTFLSGEEMEAALSGYLNVLYEQNPASVGGTLPADDFYYIP
ncbi:MAG: ABC transporter substrate-binding protein [Otoolea sp.]